MSDTCKGETKTWWVNRHAGGEGSLRRVVGWLAKVSEEVILQEKLEKPEHVQRP